MDTAVIQVIQGKTAGIRSKYAKYRKIHRKIPAKGGARERHVARRYWLAARLTGKQVVELNEKQFVKAGCPGKNKWYADLKGEVSRWLNVSVTDFSGQEPGDWKMVVDNVAAKCDYVDSANCSAEGKAKSEAMVNARASNPHVNLTGRKGNASVVEELKKQKGQSPTKEEVRAPVKMKVGGDRLKVVETQKQEMAMELNAVKELLRRLVQVEADHHKSVINVLIAIRRSQGSPTTFLPEKVNSDLEEPIMVNTVGVKPTVEAGTKAKPIPVEVVQSMSTPSPEIGISGQDGVTIYVDACENSVEGDDAKVKAYARKVTTQSKGSPPSEPFVVPRKRRKGNGVSAQVIPTKENEYALLSLVDKLSVVGFGLQRPDQSRLHGAEVPSGHVVVQVTMLAKYLYPLPIPNKHDEPKQLLLRDALNSFTLWPRDFIGAVQI
ncbi:unnamed protein product [Calypogeia fissa]